MLTLRPYQQEPISAVRAAEGCGIRHLLLALPTGCGKPVLFAHLTRQHGGRALVGVRRAALIRQAAAGGAVPWFSLMGPGLTSDEKDAPWRRARMGTISPGTPRSPSWRSRGPSSIGGLSSCAKRP
jgi:hypothetical protein